MKKNYIKGSDTLFDITEKYPETVAVFVSNGFPQMGDVKLRSEFGKAVTIETAMMLKQMDPDGFLDLLNTTISNKQNSYDATLSEKEKKIDTDIKVVGLLPCPVRLPLLEGFTDFLESFEDKTGLTVDAKLQAASMGLDWVKNNINGLENSNLLPDLFISAGFDLFFDKEKIGKFKEAGAFEHLVKWKSQNSSFAEYKLEDPKNDYSIIAVVPAVFLVNKAELGNEKVPRSWEELLFGKFDNNVSLPVGDFDLFNAILLNIYNKYEKEGVKRLARIMMSSMHPSQMIKSEKKRVRPKVTIMPYFFTKTVKEGSSMEAVWPTDGAILSPIFMLAKKSSKEKIQEIVDYFASDKVADILAVQGLFPTLNPNISNVLPKEAPFMWLGWDYIYNRDISEEIAKVEQLFKDNAEIEL